MAGSAAAGSVGSMTLRGPVTAVPEAALGDSVAVSVPVAPAASSVGVVALPPLMSLPEGCSSNNPGWFVVFVTVTVIGTLAPGSMVVAAEAGRAVSVTGASWLYATVPVTVWENSVPTVVAPCMTSISHSPGWGSAAMSEAFPVGLSVVGVASTAVTAMFPDSGRAGWGLAGRNR